MKGQRLVIIIILNILVSVHGYINIIHSLYRLVTDPIRRLRDYLPKEECVEKPEEFRECCMVLQLVANISHCTMVNEVQKLIEHYFLFNHIVLYRHTLANGQRCLYVHLILTTVCIRITKLHITYRPPFFFSACYGFSFLVHSLEYYEELPDVCSGNVEPASMKETQPIQEDCLRNNSCQQVLTI